MKRTLFLTPLLVSGVRFTACRRKGTWKYLALGGQLQEWGAKFSEGYAVSIEKQEVGYIKNS